MLPHTGPPEEFFEFLPETSLEVLMDTGWDVDGNRKLGDFNNFGFYLSDFEFRRIFDFGEIEKQLERFVLRVDYNLEKRPLEPYPHWMRSEQLKYYLEGIGNLS